MNSSSNISKVRNFRQDFGGKGDEGKKNVDDKSEECREGYIAAGAGYINVYCKLAGASLSADSLQNIPL